MNPNFYRLSLRAIAILAPLVTACAGMQRSPESGYHDTGPYLSRDRNKQARDSAASELGYGKNQVDGESEAIDHRVALDQAEKALEGKREREQYFKNKPYMASDLDRLTFLQLNSFDARQKWLNAKGVQASATTHPPQIQALVDVNDISVGMTKQAVRDSWGEPDLVEVSGNPLYGNERWHYSEQTSSTEGFHSQQRMVYFESSRVVGWESR
jgi:hypothetical protein